MPATAHANRPQPLWFIENLAYLHLGGEDTRGAYHLGEVVGRRGDMPPLHVHHRDDETFYVLEGELTLFLGEQEVTVGPGQAALAPRDVPHVYRVESEVARWLVITSPAGFEKFVRAIAERADRDELPPTGRRINPEALARAAAEAGIEVLGPPGTLPTDHRQ